MVIIRQTILKFVLLACTYHSADCDTDHSLMCSKIKLLPKKIHHTKQAGNPSIDTTKMQIPEMVEEFTKYFEDSLLTDKLLSCAFKMSDHLREVIQRTAFATFGRKSTKICDWFKAKSGVMTPVIEGKRAALAEYKCFATEKFLRVLSQEQSAADSKGMRQQILAATQRQHPAATGNISVMYKEIKTALGPLQHKMALLKTSNGEVITDIIKQMERWVEHYSELYSRALDAIEPLHIMGELCKAIDNLASGKTLGNDGIPLDLIKCCKNILLQPLHDVLR